MTGLRVLALGGREPLRMAVVEDVSFARGLERAVIRIPTHVMMEEERREVGEAWVSRHNGGTTTMSKEEEEEGVAVRDLLARDQGAEFFPL